ncbi:MAG: hypothetical protein AAGH65_08205 [Pseudomonadota bacterium]
MPLHAAIKPIIIVLIWAGPWLAAAPLWADEATPAKASLSSSQAFLGGDEFEIEFTAVDGRNLPRRNYLALDAGRYVLTVRVPARFTVSQVERRREVYDDYVDVEVALEAGQSYAVYGLWHRQDRDRPYDLVFRPLNARLE